MELEKLHKGIKEVIKSQSQMAKCLKEKYWRPDKKVPSYPGGYGSRVAAEEKCRSAEGQREPPGIQTQQWCQLESTSC